MNFTYRIKWITNGEKEYQVNFKDPIPDGFSLGRSNQIDRKNTFFYCNDGVKNITLPIGTSIPEGFVLGKIKNISLWYNDGVKNIVLTHEMTIPDGFVLGRKNVNR
jgi:hypothetical protein